MCLAHSLVSGISVSLSAASAESTKPSVVPSNLAENVDLVDNLDRTSQAY
jgi:hypothetical protein